MMRRALKIGTLLLMLMGLVSGCGSNNDDNTLPSGVQGYVDIDSTMLDDRAPKAAFDGTNYLVVYQDTAGLNHDIFGAFVSPSGAVGIPFLIDIDNVNFTNDDLSPVVAFDGTNYLVVYEKTVNSTNHDIIGTFVSPAGVVTPSFAIDESPNDDRAPAMTFGGGNYLVVYEEIVSGTDHDIIGVRVDPNPAAITPVLGYVDIDTSPNDDRAPAVSFGGGNYLVVYDEDATVTTTDHNIIGAFVDTPGAVLAGSPFNIDVTTNDDVAPAAASDGTNFLVAYQRIFSTDSDIRGALVNATGPTVGLFGIDTLIDVDDVAPAVAFDGTTNYLVAYQETFTSTDHDIIGTRVSSGGTVNPSVVFIDTSEFDDLVPAVAFGATNYLVPYEEVISSTDHNIFGARITP